jgi:SAM-dependent methyltransferase
MPVIASAGEFTVRHDCRICRQKTLVPFLDLGPMPLAGGFLRAGEIGYEHLIPLTIAVCTDCGEVQTLETIRRDLLFRDYRFLASTTATLRNHFAAFARTLSERFLAKGEMVAEIGANDGVLLVPLGQLGVRAVGFEPAANIAAVARSRGCEIIEDFVSPESARRLVATHGPARVVTASNVFAHIDDMHDAMAAISELLAPDGLFVFEVHYLPRLLETYQVDMMYHEHLMHHSLRPLARLLEPYGLEIFDVEEIPIHCGSIRVYSQRRSSPHREPVSPSVERLRQLEMRMRLDLPETFEAFGKEVVASRDRLIQIVTDLISSGKRVVGYGASGRATMHLNMCRFVSDTIPYVVDESVERQGRFVPGTGNPIVSPEVFRADAADVALLFAYNYLDEVTRKEQAFLHRGGRFLLPLPEPTIQTGPA